LAKNSCMKITVTIGSSPLTERAENRFKNKD
jgi:hypothetical protein